MSEDDHKSETIACPFCGDEMILSHFWVVMGGTELNGTEKMHMEWEGRRIRMWMIYESEHEERSPDGPFLDPASKFFRCSSCGALATDFLSGDE